MKRRRTTFGNVDDSGFSPPRRGDSETELDITPMIDVTFLLLIFFMVTSTMQGTPDLDVPPARYGTGTQLKDSLVVRIIAPGSGGNEQPLIQLGKGDIRNANLDDVTRAVEESVAANRFNVIIKADREVPHRFVQEVVRTVTAVEGAKFLIGVRDDTSR